MSGRYRWRTGLEELRLCCWENRRPSLAELQTSTVQSYSPGEPMCTHRIPHPKRHLDRFISSWLTIVTDRQTDSRTDHVYSVCITIGRIYVRSTAMRPKKSKFISADSPSLPLLHAIRQCFNCSGSKSRSPRSTHIVALMSTDETARDIVILLPINELFK